MIIKNKKFTSLASDIASLLITNRRILYSDKTIIEAIYDIDNSTDYVSTIIVQKFEIAIITSTKTITSLITQINGRYICSDIIAAILPEYDTVVITKFHPSLEDIKFNNADMAIYAMNTLQSRYYPLGVSDECAMFITNAFIVSGNDHICISLDIVDITNRNVTDPISNQSIAWIKIDPKNKKSCKS